MRPKLKLLLKSIGLILFVLILINIDREALGRHLKTTNLKLLSVAIILQFTVYAVKAFRWHVIMKAAGSKAGLKISWEIYHVGIFLANITPGKVGEFGRIYYLSKLGISSARGISAVIVDRLADLIVIIVVSSLSLGYLFGIKWTILSLAALILACILTFSFKAMLLNLSYVKAIFKEVKVFLRQPVLISTLSITLVCWLIYFMWAIVLARSVDISISALTLSAAFTITGVISLLPIAPSGLGTRDAALIVLLSGYNVSTPQIVALALLMFTTNILMSFIGGYYWLRGIKLV